MTQPVLAGHLWAPDPRGINPSPIEALEQRDQLAGQNDRLRQLIRKRSLTPTLRVASGMR